MTHNRPGGIVFVAVLMIVFGLAEVMTGFTHHFLGLRIAEGTTATYAGTCIGLLYAVAGLFILSMRRWAAALALVILITVIVGRIAMVVTGLYSVGSFKQLFGIIVGTAIVAIFV